MPIARWDYQAHATSRPRVFSCAVQIVGTGDQRVDAPAGEDPFFVPQHAIDFVGQLPVLE